MICAWFLQAGGVIADDEEEEVTALADFLRTADIGKANARKYARMIHADGTPSVTRLRKQVQREGGYLTRIGITNPLDVEEIMELFK